MQATMQTRGVPPDISDALGVVFGTQCRVVDNE